MAMIPKIFGFLVLILVHSFASACTCFFLHHQGQKVFGRNYDWIADAGIVCTNQRGLVKTSMATKDGSTISWQSRYGSITFNQYGKEFPTGGMNEAGLVVELMWLDGTRYPAPDQRPSIGVLQWIQFQLDNFSTVDEVIATDKQLRIVSGGTPLHYLVADSGAHAATIEFLEGNMVVHRDDALPFPVLTNDTYKKSITSFRSGSSSPANNSLERFNTACRMISDPGGSSGNLSLIDYSFEILDKVSQGDFTRWSIVYDLAERMIYFKTHAFPQRRTINFSNFDFACAERSFFININRPEAGDLSQFFSRYPNPEMADILKKSIRQSASRILINEAQMKSILEYPGTISCK